MANEKKTGKAKTAGKGKTPASYVVNFMGAHPFLLGRTLQWDPFTKVLSLLRFGENLGVEVTLTEVNGEVCHYLGSLDGGTTRFLMVVGTAEPNGRQMLVGRLERSIGTESGVWGAEAGGGGAGYDPE